MKALLQSGDEERIVRFAHASRSRDLYLLAAQFLHACGRWRSDPAVLRSLAGFYTKAKSPQHSAAFQESCAQAALDDGPDFDRAKAALTVCFPFSPPRRLRPSGRHHNSVPTCSRKPRKRHVSATIQLTRLIIQLAKAHTSQWRRAVRRTPLLTNAYFRGMHGSTGICTVTTHCMLRWMTGLRDDLTHARPAGRPPCHA